MPTRHTGDLAGTVALVTGGGRGIGAAVARALAAHGAKVGVAARSDDQVRDVAREIGGLALAGDVSVAGDVERWAAAIEQDFGPLDLVVNNAGIVIAEERAWEVDPDEWWRVLEVNVRGPLLVCRATIPRMLARGRGRVVNVVSRAAYSPGLTIGAYATSKAALVRFGETLADQLHGTGLSVFSLVPGRVETEMTRGRWPAGTAFTPPEIAADLVCAIAAGRHDRLSGRILLAEQDADPEELAGRTDDIVERDLRSVRLRSG